MSIVYTLHANTLTSDPTAYRAIVSPPTILGLEDVITCMMQGGSTVTQEDTLAVLEAYHTAIIALVLAGTTVTTPLVNFGAPVRGTFKGQTGSFDSSRHAIQARLNPGTHLRDALRTAHAQKGERRPPVPTRLEYLDINSRQQLADPGGMGQLAGQRLKFAPVDLQ